MAVGGLAGGGMFSPPVASVEGNWGSIILGDIILNLNQSYFMSLFFFFSRYFVPKSFDKRGTQVFLVERAKRLGIPFVLMAFVIGPYIARGFEYLFFYQGDESFAPSTGSLTGVSVTWFLQQLIVMSIAYAFACGKGWSPKITCPSLCGFFGIATVLGLTTGVVLMFFPVMDNVIFVPVFWISIYLTLCSFSVAL